MTEKARTYAKVLYELSIPEDMAKDAFRLFEENPMLKEALSSPVVPMHEKFRVVDRVFEEPRFSRLMASYLKKACEAGCIGQIGQIAQAYEKCLLEGQGVLEASLLCVTEPDEEQIKGIKAFLAGKHGCREVKLTVEKEPELMGGFVLKAGDTEYDYSLGGRLKKLAQAVAR